MDERHAQSEQSAQLVELYRLRRIGKTVSMTNIDNACMRVTATPLCPFERSLDPGHAKRCLWTFHPKQRAPATATLWSKKYRFRARDDTGDMPFCRTRAHAVIGAIEAAKSRLGEDYLLVSLETHGFPGAERRLWARHGRHRN